jgi:hypothetical protein
MHRANGVASARKPDRCSLRPTRHRRRMADLPLANGGHSSLRRLGVLGSVVVRRKSSSPGAQDRTRLFGQGRKSCRQAPADSPVPYPSASAGGTASPCRTWGRSGLLGGAPVGRPRDERAGSKGGEMRDRTEEFRRRTDDLVEATDRLRHAVVHFKKSFMTQTRRMESGTPCRSPCIGEGVSRPSGVGQRLGGVRDTQVQGARGLHRRGSR